MDFKKCSLYGLQNCKLMIPIISELGWQSILSILFLSIISLPLKTLDTQSANTIANNKLKKDYEYAISGVSLQSAFIIQHY